MNKFIHDEDAKYKAIVRAINLLAKMECHKCPMYRCEAKSIKECKHKLEEWLFR